MRSLCLSLSRKGIASGSSKKLHRSLPTNSRSPVRQWISASGKTRSKRSISSIRSSLSLSLLPRLSSIVHITGKVTLSWTMPSIKILILSILKHQFLRSDSTSWSQISDSKLTTARAMALKFTAKPRWKWVRGL